MTHLLYSFLFAGLYVYLGLGLALMITPPALTRYRILFAPLAGYAYMTLAGWYLLVSGFPGTDNYWLLLCLPPLAFLGLGFYRTRRDPEQPFVPLFNKDVAIASASGLLGFAIAAFPSIAFRKGLTAITLGNADVAYYSMMARYVKGSVHDPRSYLLANPQISSTALDRFGTVLTTAFPSSALSLETFEVQNIAMHVFFAVTILMVYVAAREVFGFSRSRAALGAGLTAVNPLFYYVVWHNFEGQIIGSALGLALIVLHTQAASAGTVSTFARYFPMTVLLTWGLSASYGHMVLILLAAVGVYVLHVSWNQRSPELLGRWIAFCVATLAATIVCSPERARLAFGQLTFFGGGIGALTRAPQGWFVPWLLPAGLFLQPNAFPWNNVSVPGFVQAVLSIASVVLISVGLVRSRSRHPALYVVVSSWFAVIVAGTTLLAFVDRTGAGWGGYASFKFLTFFLPLVLFVMLAWLAEPVGLSRSGLAVCGACLAVIAGVGSYYLIRETRVMLGVSGVTPEMAGLRSVEDDPRVHSINISAGEYVGTMWKANFLARKALFFEQGTYYPASTLRGDWTLTNVEKSVPGQVLNISVFEQRDLIRVNAQYSLVRAAQALTAQLGSGWYPFQSACQWMGDGGASGTVLVEVKPEAVPISVSANYWPLNARNVLSLYLDGHPIADCPDNSACHVSDIELSRGRHVLEFRAALPPAIPDNGDPRALSYCFSRIQLDSSP